MTLADAIATQPYWVTIWLNWLLFGAFILPFSLLIWRATRIAAVITVAASVAAGLSVDWLFQTMGYVKLLGAPHLVFWIPLLIYLWRLIRQPATPVYARYVLYVIGATIMVSLAFDIVDVARYALGERGPAPGTF